jgi:hypothetical protein
MVLQLQSYQVSLAFSTFLGRFWNRLNRIKYVYITVTPYNRVDDIAYSEIEGKSKTVLEHVGYLEPNERNMFGWGNVWYNSSISYIKINEIEIIYGG